MRIVSLLSAATEIVAALGMIDQLAGVSHECDYPPEVNSKPRVTRCPIYGAGLSSNAVDRWVSETLAAGGDLYTLDVELLRELAPDVILTQQLCEVCSISAATVTRALATLPRAPRMIELSPNCLADILQDIGRVAEALDVQDRGEALVTSLNARVDFVRDRTSQAASRPMCFLMEWIDPPYCSGHWSPELVALAGGHDPLGRPGADSTRVSWESVLQARPEVIVAACCGWSVERTQQDLPILEACPGWNSLPAVRAGRVHVVDGSAYFSRHGPRIADSLEILAEILHPDLFAGCFPDRGAVRVGA